MLAFRLNIFTLTLTTIGLNVVKIILFSRKNRGYFKETKCYIISAVSESLMCMCLLTLYIVNTEQTLEIVEGDGYTRYLFYGVAVFAILYIMGEIAATLFYWVRIVMNKWKSPKDKKVGNSNEADAGALEELEAGSNKSVNPSVGKGSSTTIMRKKSKGSKLKKKKKKSQNVKIRKKLKNNLLKNGKSKKMSSSKMKISKRKSSAKTSATKKYESVASDSPSIKKRDYNKKKNSPTLSNASDFQQLRKHEEEFES